MRCCNTGESRGNFPPEPPRDPGDLPDLLRPERASFLLEMVASMLLTLLFPEVMLVVLEAELARLEVKEVIMKFSVLGESEFASFIG